MAIYTPPAPQISGDARLEVFAHRGLSTVQREPFGDARRLRALGRPMLLAAYTAAINQARPDLLREQFKEYIDGTFPAFVNRCVERYHWRESMYGVPHDVDLTSLEETQWIFEVYAGAVVAEPRLGQPMLFRWIADLVNLQ
ncbi:hypothetical protein C8Q74DRAFT_1221937 [Fomes fomentarius]|nr:hypothetical protein C8Q74DRAFT_1221937 [Fomes fomentarius]